MRVEKGVLLILFVAFTACASNNNSTTTSSGSQNNAVASSKRNLETIQSASGDTCVIDEKKVCEEGTPGVDDSDPYYTAGKEMREKVAGGDETGGTTTATLRYTLSLLQGDRPVILICGVEKGRQSFKFGQLATSGIPTNIDIEKIRAHGYCVE